MVETLDEIIVIKYGGSIYNKKELNFFKKVASYQNPIVIVHGGSEKINQNLKKLNIKPKFVKGLRYTDKKTLEIVINTLSDINKDIVSMLKRNHKKVVGLFADMILSQRIRELGFVGKPKSIRLNFLFSLLKNGYIPVIAPISSDNKGNLLNINADDVASIISVRLKASKLIFFTEVGGILDKKNRIIREIKVSEIDSLIKNGVVRGGMIPKIKSCKNAILNGVKAVLIANPKYGLNLVGTTIRM